MDQNKFVVFECGLKMIIRKQINSKQKCRTSFWIVGIIKGGNKVSHLNLKNVNLISEIFRYYYYFSQCFVVDSNTYKRLVWKIIILIFEISKERTCENSSLIFRMVSLQSYINPIPFTFINAHTVLYYGCDSCIFIYVVLSFQCWIRIITQWNSITIIRNAFIFSV